MSRNKTTSPPRASGRLPIHFVLALIRVVLWSCALPGISEASAAIPEYELEGEVTETEFKQDASVLRTGQYRFSVAVRGSDWWIRTSPVPLNGVQPAISFFETGTDGTNIYRVVRLNPDFDSTAANREQIQLMEKVLRELPGEAAEREQLRQAIKELERDNANKPDLKNSSNQAVGQVSPLPFMEWKAGDCSALLWFAYCSRRYLDGVRDGRSPQFWPYERPGQYLTNNLVPGVVQRAEGDPGLPRCATFLNDGHDFDIFLRSTVRRPLPPPFDRGYTNAVYETSGITNLNGALVPLNLSLAARFRPKDAATFEDLFVRYKYEARVTRARPGCARMGFVPSLEVTTLMEDRRAQDLPGVNRVQYLAPAGQWNVTTNLAELKEADRRMRARLRAEANRRRLRVILLSTTVLAFGFFVIQKLRSPLPPLDHPKPQA